MSADHLTPREVEQLRHWLNNHREDQLELTDEVKAKLDQSRREIATGQFTTVPSLASFIVRGIIGFTLVSLAGFAPWVFAGRWFYRNVGELGLYAVCAVVFIASSGLFLHRLILGRGSLARFYKVFTVVFLAYAVGWTAGWMLLRGHAGSLVGLFVGTVLMAFILTVAFDAREAFWKTAAALFLLNSAGYFIGGWLEGAVSHRITGKLLWGLCYGIGFGAGLGLAFYLCQRGVNRKSEIVN